jgi:hypothetical protein
MGDDSTEVRLADLNDAGRVLPKSWSLVIQVVLSPSHGAYAKGFDEQVRNSSIGFGVCTGL